MGQTIVFIVSIILSIVIVNGIQQVFMKLIGANVMFFSGKTKLVWILLVGLVIFEFVGGLFGLA